MSTSEHTKEDALFADVRAQAIRRFHDECLRDRDWPASTPARFDDPVWKHIELNHRFNSMLWQEEDQARRRNVPDSEIAANKRAIDRSNQQRQDAIERIDEGLLARLEDRTPRKGARRNSETAGSMVDRLSILSLKTHHMRLQTERTDVESSHVAACAQKLAVLREQRADLENCLDQLLADTAAGRAYFRVYRQFKMYNDPALNPYLYKNNK